VATGYGRQWKQQFGTRMRTASVLANAAIAWKGVSTLLPLVATFPRLLTIGAWLSGKTRTLTPLSQLRG
jgi:hypothetical protein